MEELIKLLKEIDEDIDYTECEDLIDGRKLGSFEIIRVIADIEETFDISIMPDDITNENLNSAKAMWNMIVRLKNENK